MIGYYNGKRYEMHFGLKVTIVDDHHFKMLFENGITKLYDIRKGIEKYPELVPLQDKVLFKNIKKDCYAGPRWTDEIDISAETVYEEGETIPSDKDSDAIILGFKIWELRCQNGLTQEELAKKANILQSDLSKLENGKFNPTLSSIRRIADALDADLSFNLKPNHPKKKRYL